MLCARDTFWFVMDRLELARFASNVWQGLGWVEAELRMFFFWGGDTCSHFLKEKCTTLVSDLQF